MAYTEYALPSITNTIPGTFAVTLFSGIGDLVIPTFNTILQLGALKEVMDRSPGESELATFELTVRDDYSTYTEGFWFKVLSDSSEKPQLRFYLNEGSGNIYFFWGELQEEETPVEELYVSSAPKYFRRIEIKLVALLSKAKDVLISDWIAEIVTEHPDSYLIPTNKTSIGEPTQIIKAKDIFGAFLAVMFDQGYLDSDTVWLYDGSNTDLQFYDGASWLNFDDIYIAVYESDGVGGEHLTDYFNAAEPEYLPTLYGESEDTKQGFQFFVDCLRSFGFAIRHFYGKADETIDSTPANNHHRFQLLQRGRAYSGLITFGKQPKESSPILIHDFIVKGIYIFDKIAPTHFAWCSRVFGGISLTSPPANAEFDMDQACLFEVGSVLPRQLYTSAGDPYSSVRYYNYWSQAMTELSGTYRLLKALAGYYFFRYPKRSRYERTYGPMLAIDGGVQSHRSIVPLKRHEIANGSTTPTFWANEVIKRPWKDEVEISWFKE